MHSIEIYSIRVFDKNISGPIDERYADLSKIRGHCLLDILASSLGKNGGALFDLREVVQRRRPGKDVRDIPRKVFRCASVTREQNYITGYLKVGEYGTKNQIINRKTGQKIGDLNVDDSVLRDHFFYVEIRPGQKKALLLLQAINGKGIKSVFEEFTQDDFKKTTGNLSCQVRPLAHKALAEKWLNEADVCEIRLSGFSTSGPINDVAERLGDSYAEVILKPKKRSGRLGKLSKFDGGMIDLLKSQANKVKVQVEYDGRKRLFNLGVDEAPVSSIEMDEEDSTLKFVNGNPTEESTKSFVAQLARDIWELNL